MEVELSENEELENIKVVCFLVGQTPGGLNSASSHL
jgi:hypothetical protein